MADLFHRLVERAAARAPDATALLHKETALSYGMLDSEMRRVASGLAGLGLGPRDRVGIWLEKRPEMVISMFAAAAAGLVFVPLNPLLLPHQLRHIMTDCNVRCLVTSSARLAQLGDVLPACADLHSVVLVDDGAPAEDLPERIGVESFAALTDAAEGHRAIDTDMTAILYTSGSTGAPKGVVLSHRNLVAGAESVATYLENTPDDVILSILPLSFDAGLSQITTACYAGAAVGLIDYLLPRDVARAAARWGATGIGGVPPLWHQLAAIDWPEEAVRSLRYFTNTGGHMSRTLLEKLRGICPGAAPYLMYGLTEAFRSTYLPPADIDSRPDSIGKAIPNAEIMVVADDGHICGPGEEGELVHRGALVSMGYWNDPARTAERFRPAPGHEPALPLPEMAVWSGDTVRLDDDGYLYFVGRRDDMIKTSGYRVSPTEVEEIILNSGYVREAIVAGVPDVVLGQAIVAVAVPPHGGDGDEKAVIDVCRSRLPQYMVPRSVAFATDLPRNPNGKIDRKAVVAAHFPQDEGSDT